MIEFVMNVWPLTSVEDEEFDSDLADVEIDAKVFDNLDWDVECTGLFFFINILHLFYTFTQSANVACCWCL